MTHKSINLPIYNDSYVSLTLWFEPVIDWGFPKDSVVQSVTTAQ